MAQFNDFDEMSQDLPRRFGINSECERCAKLSAVEEYLAGQLEAVRREVKNGHSGCSNNNTKNSSSNGGGGIGADVEIRESDIAEDGQFDYGNEAQRDVDKVIENLEGAGEAESEATITSAVETPVQDYHCTKEQAVGKEEDATSAQVTRDTTSAAETTEDSSHTCDICKKTFATDAAFARHVDVSHRRIMQQVADINSKKEKKVKDRSRDADVVSHKCHVCDCIFASPLSLAHHAKAAGHEMKEESRCKVKSCGLTFPVRSELKRHENTVHSSVHECAHCGKKFPKRHSRDTHVNSVHLKLRPFRCQTCGKDFAQKTNLSTHDRIFHRKVRYSCRYCPREFSTLGSGLHKHVARVHLGIRNHKCDRCGKVFADAKALTVHKAAACLSKTADGSQKANLP